MDDRALEAGAREILSDFELWADVQCSLTDRPSVLVSDFCLREAGDLFTYEATHLTAAGRSLAQVHLDSVWISHDVPMQQKLRFSWQAPERPSLHSLCLHGFVGKCLVWDASLLYPPANATADLAIDNICVSCRSTRGPKGRSLPCTCLAVPGEVGRTLDRFFLSWVMRSFQERLRLTMTPPGVTA